MPLISDENFRANVRKVVPDKDYVKACPNLTLQDVVTWPNEMHEVDVSC